MLILFKNLFVQILILFKYLYWLLFKYFFYLLFKYFFYSNTYFIQIHFLHVGHRSPSVTHFQKFSQGGSIKKNFEKRVTEGDRWSVHKHTKPSL